MVKKSFFIKFLFLLFTFSSGVSQYAAAQLGEQKGVLYRPVIFGIEDKSLRRMLQKASYLFTEQSKPPETVEALRRRAINDLKNLEKVLHAEGYYDASLEFYIDLRSSPVGVYINIKPGKQYTIKLFKMVSIPNNNHPLHFISSNLDKIGIKIGAPAKSEVVRSAANKVLEYLGNNGYPFAIIEDKKVVIDRSEKKMMVALLVKPGSLAHFGDIKFDKLAGVTIPFLQTHIKWKKGEVFSNEKLEETAKSLTNTELFKAVRITHGSNVDKHHRLNVTIDLEKAHYNAVRLGLQYTSSIKLEANALYEHRNLFGEGELLALEGSWSSIRRGAEIRLHAPNFFGQGVDSTEKFGGAMLKTPAFKSTGVEILSLIGFRYNEHIEGSIGVMGEMENANRPYQGRKDYTYVGLPVSMDINYIEGKLGPHKGWKLELGVKPLYKANSTSTFLMLYNASTDIYLPLSKEENFVAHLRADVALSSGVNESQLAPDKRFYAGGYNSIRGYSYQMAGPINSAYGYPLGGLSRFTGSISLLYYFSEKLAFTAFFDGGNVFEKNTPNFSQPLLYGVGSGIRIFTNYGNIYFDVAAPIINKRPTVDRSIEFYVGFNKSF